MINAIFQKMGSAVDISLDDLDGSGGEGSGTGAACRVDDAVEGGVGRRRAGHVIADEMEKGRTGVIAETGMCPCLVSSGCIYVNVAMGHQYLHDATADKSGGTGNKYIHRKSKSSKKQTNTRICYGRIKSVFSVYEN